MPRPRRRRPAPRPAAGAAALGAAAAAWLAVVGLAACGRSAPPPCPQVGIVSGAESANFDGAGDPLVGDDPQAIAFRGAILGFGGGCAYRSDGARVRLGVDLSGVPGPAYAGGEIRIPYFVAVLDPAGTVLDKQVFEAVLPRPAGREAVGQRDTIEQRLRGVTRADGPGWRVLLGVDLPPEAAVRAE